VCNDKKRKQNREERKIIPQLRPILKKEKDEKGDTRDDEKECRDDVCDGTRKIRGEFPLHDDDGRRMFFVKRVAHFCASAVVSS